jgi:hypothetical protein
MEVFFAINGFFAIFLLQKITVKQFIINRLQRIVLPLLLGLIVLSPAVLALGLSWQMKLPLTHILPQVVVYLRAHPLPLAHLWSLWYLVIIYAVFLGIFRVFGAQIFVFFAKTSGLKATIFTIVLSAICLAAYPQKFTAPPINTWVDAHIVAYFSVYFALGAWYYFHQNNFQKITQSKHLWWITLLSMGINIWVQTTDHLHITIKTLGSAAYTTQVFCVMIYLTWAVQKVKFNPKLTQKIAQSAYFIYWIEMPLVLLAHYLFIDTIPAVCLVIGTTIFIFLVGYWVFHTFLQRSIWGSAPKA